MVPSAVPSITGSVSSLSMSGTVSSELETSDLKDITIELADIYGVDVSDIETTVDYIASGTLDVTIPDGLSEDEAVEVLRESISNVLGVHPKDIVVTIDENGAVDYSVSGANYDEVASVQMIADQNDFATRITDELKEDGSLMSVESSTVNPDLEIMVSTTVDTTDATVKDDPAGSINELTEQYGFTDSTVQGTTSI